MGGRRAHLFAVARRKEVLKRAAFPTPPGLSALSPPLCATCFSPSPLGVGVFVYDSAAQRLQLYPAVTHIYTHINIVPLSPTHSRLAYLLANTLLRRYCAGFPCSRFNDIKSESRGWLRDITGIRSQAAH